MIKIHALKLIKIKEKDLLFNEKKKYYEMENDEIREKIFIYNTYYDFMENESCLNFISNTYELIQDNHQIKIKNEDKLAISIILLKSFIDKKNLTQESVIYINSDDIFNYVYDQFLKYLITIKLYMSDRSIKNLIIHILDILVGKNIINFRKITIRGEFFKTRVYYSLDTGSYVRKDSHFFNFSYDIFRWLEVEDKYYITTHHYSKTYEVNKKNFNSNRSFKIKDKNYILNKINLKLYVDDEYQDGLKNIFKSSITEINEKIRTTVKDLNNLFNKEIWGADTKNKLATLQQDLNKLTDESTYIQFSKHDFGNSSIIFPLFMDFRGRKYYSSAIGPTSSKILRLSYYYGYYDENDFSTDNIKYSADYKFKIIDFCIKNNINKELKFQEEVFWCLISIGKFYINKDNYPITTDNFLQAAIDNYDEDVENIEDRVELMHYKRILNSFWEKKIKKRALIKDATASINQIFMKKLGPINQDSLNYVNLGSENLWYDTYLVHRDKFIEHVLNEKKDYSEIIIKKVLTRKLIKNTIMTIPYSAGFSLCWEKYVSLIKEGGYNINVDSNLKKIYKNFYTFVKNTMQEKYLYNKSTNLFISKINEKFEDLRKYILESDTGEADISYYKMKRSSIDKKYVENGVKKRITKLILVPTSALDIESFNVASGANTAHFLDADEIREIEIELNKVMVTVHDSFLIDISSCTKLVDVKIKHYQKNLDKISSGYKISNIFILL